MHLLREADDVARPLDDHVSIQLGFLHRLDDLCLRGAVHDGVETLAVDRCMQRLRVRDVGDAERYVRREVGAVAGGDVVDDDHQIAARLQRIDDRAADEAGAAGDENAHRCSLFHNCGQRPVDNGRQRPQAVDGRALVLRIVS